MSHSPTPEQLNIINLIKQDYQCYCDAVPGAGKSTLSYFIAQKFIDKNILSVTFSKNLKLEAREKIKKLGLTNMKIESYHSLAHNFYDKSVINNTGILKILYNNTELISSEKYDLLILDETQDMSRPHYNLIQKFIRDNNPQIQLLVLGDRDQGVFKFIGSDIRYLTLSNKIFHGNFTQSNLSVSHRMTNQMSQFVNNFLLGYDKIKTNKNGKKVQYLISNPYKRDLFDYIFEHIRNKVENENYKLEDIFILANSVKSKKAPIKRFENYLAKKKINDKQICIFINKSDEGELDNEIIRNKIVLTTFHQSKGRERKLVIVFGMDEGYYKFTNTLYNKTEDCPSPIYVALTRGIDELIIIQSYGNNITKRLPCSKLNIRDLENSDYCEVKRFGLINDMKIDIPYTNNTKKKHSDSVTGMTKYIRDNILHDILLLLPKVFKTVNSKSRQIYLKSKIRNFKNNTAEDVSNINGIIIPAIWETKYNNCCTLFTRISNYANSTKYIDGGLKYQIKKLEDNYPFTKIEDYMRLGNVYTSITDNTLSNIYQIYTYDWMKEREASQCLDVFTKHVSTEEIKFEFLLGNDYEYNHKKYGKINLIGFVDCMNTDSVYEFKCTSELNEEHKCQLILYYWLWNKSNMDEYYKKKIFKLMNILTEEILELNTSSPYINDIVELLFKNKYNTDIEITDSKFIQLSS